MPEDNEPDQWRKQKLKEIRDYSEEQFDRLIVYLSSGAVVISVTLVNNIIDLSCASSTGFLKASWILFTSSLILILFSHRTARRAIDLELNQEEDKSDQYDSLTDYLTKGAFTCLLFGLVVFIIFVWVNIK